MKNTKNKKLTKTDVKFLLKPLAILSVVAILLITIFVIGFKQIGLTNKKFKTAEKNRNLLIQNLQVLTKFNVKDLDQNFINVAIPEKNAQVYFMSQLRSLSSSSNLILSNVKTSAGIPSKNGITKYNVSFDVEGAFPNINSFTNSLTKVLPIMVLDKVKMSLTGDLARSSISVNVFSAEFPEKIPSLSSPVKDLDPDEYKLISTLFLEYKLPAISKIENVDGETGRNNPFE